MTSHGLRIVSSWKGRLCLLVCVRSQALNSLICSCRSCCAETSAAGSAVLLPGFCDSSESAASGRRRGMVEARNGFFRTGLDAVFRVLEAGRDML
jgi:hypothetical protein